MACLKFCGQGSKAQSNDTQFPNVPISTEPKSKEYGFSESQTKLSEQENQLVTTETTTTVNVREIWHEVHALERQHSVSSKYRNFGHTLEPVVDFFVKFGPAIDSAVQYGSTPSTLLWGALKAVINVSDQVDYEASPH